jgi:hypothetical protein
MNLRGDEVRGNSTIFLDYCLLLIIVFRLLFFRLLLLLLLIGKLFFLEIVFCWFFNISFALKFYKPLFVLIVLTSTIY